MWTQTAFQDKLIEELHAVEFNGVGLHRKRSRAAVIRRAEKDLAARGYTVEQVQQLVKEARDMVSLELICEE